MDCHLHWHISWKYAGIRETNLYHRDGLVTFLFAGWRRTFEKSFSSDWNSRWLASTSPKSISLGLHPPGCCYCCCLASACLAEQAHSPLRVIHYIVPWGTDAIPRYRCSSRRRGGGYLIRLRPESRYIHHGDAPIGQLTDLLSLPPWTEIWCNR